VPRSDENVRFQLLVSGKVRGIGALKSTGVLSVAINWVRRELAAAPKQLREQPKFREEDWVCNEADVSCAGLDAVTGRHVHWFAAPLKVGDEVTVRVLPAGKYDAPRGGIAACHPHRALPRARPAPKRRRRS
jgi:hypothetical protein